MELRELHGSLFKLSPGANFTYWQYLLPLFYTYIFPFLCADTYIHSDRQMYDTIRGSNLLFQHRGEAKGGGEKVEGINSALIVLSCVHTLMHNSRLSLSCCFRLFSFLIPICTRIWPLSSTNTSSQTQQQNLLCRFVKILINLVTTDWLPPFHLVS